MEDGLVFILVCCILIIRPLHSFLEQSLALDRRCTTTEPYNPNFTPKRFEIWICLFQYVREKLPLCKMHRHLLEVRCTGSCRPSWEVSASPSAHNYGGATPFSHTIYINLAYITYSNFQVGQ